MKKHSPSWQVSFQMKNDVVKAFELAPDGIITYIYPREDNDKAFGLDVLTEHERSIDANLAKETKEYTLGGPYELRQAEWVHCFSIQSISQLMAKTVYFGGL